MWQRRLVDWEVVANARIWEWPALKVAFNLLVLGAEITADHAPVLERLKALGYDGVEVPVFTGDVQRYAALGALSVGVRKSVV